MNCEKCLNRGDCEDCIQAPMVAVKFCPKCKKQAAEYRFNEAGNLAFYECIYCGYTAEEYAKDLKEEK